jgi:hypothetical protein
LINVHTDAVADDSDSGEQLAAEWTANTKIGLSSRNTFMLSTSALPVQQVFQAAVKLMEKYIMFTDAYPDCNPHSKFPWAQGLFIQAACDLECDEIITRLHHDAVYAKTIADAVSPFAMSPYTSDRFFQLETRLSQFRGKVKHAVASRVEGMYFLTGRDSSTRIERLLLNKQYIYPGNIEVSYFYFQPCIAYRKLSVNDREGSRATNLINT